MRTHRSNRFSNQNVYYKLKSIFSIIFGINIEFTMDAANTVRSKIRRKDRKTKSNSHYHIFWNFPWNNNNHQNNCIFRYTEIECGRKWILDKYFPWAILIIANVMRLQQILLVMKWCCFDSIFFNQTFCPLSANKIEWFWQKKPDWTTFFGYKFNNLCVASYSEICISLFVMHNAKIDVSFVFNCFFF